MERALFSTTTSTDRFLLPRDRSAEDPRSPLAQDAAAAHPLPRHLLVSLAGITAEVTSLQQRCADAPQLLTPLAAILARLDGLVDSIHQHAADQAATNVHDAAGLAVGSPSDARTDVPVDVPNATTLTRSPTRVDQKEERLDGKNDRPRATSSMIYLAELDRLMQGRLRTTVEVYYEARRAFLDASRQAEAEEGLGIMLPMSRMSSADDVIEMSQWLIAPWVALVEGTITLDEALARIAIMDDLGKAAQRESMMRWLAIKRGPDTPALEEILIAAGRRFGMGDPAPWPSDAAWDDPDEDGAEGDASDDA